MITTIIGLATLSSLALPAPLVVLATHEFPTKIEQTFLAKPLAEWQKEAEMAGYIVIVEPSTIYVRHENLFNLKAMDDRMEVFGVVQTLLAKGKSTTSLGELSERQRFALRATLADSLVGREAGALLANDKCEVMFDTRTTLNVSDGKRSFQFRPPVATKGDESESFYSPEPSEAEMKKYREEELPKYVMKPYRDGLVLSYSKSVLPSAAKVLASEEFAHILYELLEEQQTKISKSYDAMRAAMLGELALPKEGSRADQLNDATQRFLKDNVLRNGGVSGAMSDAEINAFLNDAKVQSIESFGLIGIGIKKANGQREGKFALVNLRRNPGN